MQVGVFAKTFPGSNPASVLRQVAEAGFDAAHYNMACSGLPSMPDDISGEAARAVAVAGRAAGIPLPGVSGTYNMIHPDPERRAAGHRRLEVIAGACAAMGTLLISLCTGTRDPDDQWRFHPDNAAPAAWRDLREAMETAIGIAERHGVILGIEPELANVVNSAAAARRLIDEAGSDRLAVIIDPANLFEVAPPADQRRLVSEAVDLLADRIVMAHAKDRAPDGGFATAGQGVIDFRHYLTELRRAGFDGPVIAHGLPAEDAPGVAAFLKNELRGLAA